MTPLVAGDVAILYDIQARAFLCHDTRTFAGLDAVHRHKLQEWHVDEDVNGTVQASLGKCKRVVLLSQPLTGRGDRNWLENYYRELHCGKLSYFKHE